MGQWLVSLTKIRLLPWRKPYIYYPVIPLQAFRKAVFRILSGIIPLPYILLPVHPQSPHMSLLGALQGLPYACSRSARKTARKRCLWKPVCLCQYGKTDCSIIPMNAGKWSARFHTLAWQMQGWLPMMQGWGSIRRKAEKSWELRGAQRSLAKYDLTCLGCILLQAMLRNNFTGKREALRGEEQTAGETVLRGRNNLYGQKEKPMPGKSLYGEGISLSGRVE